MSFVQSNLTTKNFNSVFMSGTKCIATSNSENIGLYYSSDSGETWYQSNITSLNFNSVYMVGANCIAGGNSSNGLYYSSDYGNTWTQSDITYQNFMGVCMNGQYCIAFSSSAGMYSGMYSSNYGHNWSISYTLKNIMLLKPLMSGSYCLGFSNTSGIYLSSNSGITWSSLFSVYSIKFSAMANFEQYAIAGCDTIANNSAMGVYYSSDYGQSWTYSADIRNVSFSSMYMNGQHCVGGSKNSNGIFYSSDYGHTWSQSNITNDNISSIFLNGNLGVACSSSSNGIYTTDDYGQTWTQSNVTSGNFSSSFITSTNVIAASVSNLGIYHNSSALCYDKSTTVLCVSDDRTEQYVPISDLNIGDNVKIYNQKSQSQTKKIKYINYYNHLCMDSTNDLDCIYKSNDDHNLIVSGGHSLLVDKLTDQQQELNMRFNFNEKLNDKHLLLASSNENFTNITRQYPKTMRNSTKLYHLVLENDDDIDLKYGIYVNDGVLSETCSQREYMKIHIA